MSARVAIVSAVYPYPRDNGKRVVLSGLVDYFSDRYGNDALQYLWVTRDASLKDSDALNLVRLPTPSRLQQGLQAAQALVGASPRSMQEAVLYSPEVVRNLESALDEFSPDLVLADTFRIGQLLQAGKYRTRTVMYMDDLFSLRYERMLAVRNQGYRAGFSAIGNFGSIVPHAWAKLAGHPVVESALLKFEMGRTRKREVQVAEQFPLNLLINSDEAQVFQGRLHNAQVATIKPLMNVNSEPLPRRLSKKLPQFVLLGDLRIAHNRHATSVFLQKVVSGLRDTVPNARIKVVGRGLDEELEALIRLHDERVEYLGFVENLDQLLSETTALLVPLQFGTGVKIKTLEALARGIPVVSTGFGVEGIPGAENACIVDDDIGNFPEYMRQLTDRAVNEIFSKRALMFYRQEYSRANVYTEYDLLFQRWLEGE